MTVDFFEQVNSHLPELNVNERKLFDYVVHNIRQMVDCSIRQMAQDNYVSTTTIVRFVKKLGFEGYREFSNSIRVAVHSMDKTEIPQVFREKQYKEEYLKNIMESMRVLPLDTVERFRTALSCAKNIYFYGDGLDRDAAHYAYRLFTSMGYCTYFPADNYEVSSMLAHISDGDILFLFSLTGESEGAIEMVENSKLRCRPLVASFTWSGNNTLQNLSDLDFYMFADKLTYNGYNLTSRVSMIAIVEMLAYYIIATEK